MREKIWGARDLSPIFGPQNSPIGEAWYSYEENVAGARGFHGYEVAADLRVLDQTLKLLLLYRKDPFVYGAHDVGGDVYTHHLQA